MTQYAFGSGTLIAKRTDITGTPPSLFGTLDSVEIDFDRKIETLLGQYNMAVAAGGGEFKITGKAKYARLQAAQFNNLFLGQTLTANSMLEMTTGETDTVASGAVTVVNSATFVEDYGVFYAASGAQLTPVTASPAQGQYSVSSGVYGFNTADNGAAVLIYYSYNVSSGNKVSLANQLAGPLPTFEVALKETFNYYGTSKDLIVKLNACVSSKLSLPFTNQKFTVAEFDFQAIADASNNIGTISLSE
ncbi:MAG: hypothetical protein WA280_12540 [Xanthobacteraceae bacterium]